MSSSGSIGLACSLSRWRDLTSWVRGECLPAEGGGVDAGGRGLEQHRLGRLLEGDEQADLGAFALDGALEVADHGSTPIRMGSRIRARTRTAAPVGRLQSS